MVDFGKQRRAPLGLGRIDLCAGSNVLTVNAIEPTRTLTTAGMCGQTMVVKFAEEVSKLGNPAEVAFDVLLTSNRDVLLITHKSL